MILPRRQSVGGAIGSGLGQGLSSGMQALANMKLEQLKQSQQMDAMKPYLNALLGGQQGGVQPGQPITSQEGAPGVSNISQGEGTAMGRAPIDDMIPEQKAALAMSLLSGKPSSAAQVLSGIGKEKSRAASVRERSEFQRDERLSASNEKVLDSFAEESQSNYELLDTVGEMENLLAKGNLPDPVLFSVVDHFGKMLGVDNAAALFGGDAEVMNSLSKSFLKQLPRIFGSKPSVEVVKMLMQTFPTLRTTPEGSGKMLDIIKKVSKGKILPEESAQEILARNNGKPVSNLKGRAFELARAKQGNSYRELETSINDAISYAKSIGFQTPEEQAKQSKFAGKEGISVKNMANFEGLDIELDNGIKGRVQNGKFVPNTQ